MWLRFLDVLRCPMCKGQLHLDVFHQEDVALAPEHRSTARRRGITDARLACRVDAGALSCRPCAALFPVIDGLPVLLCYRTPLRDEFMRRHADKLGGHDRVSFPDREPEAGERDVMQSFSTEWLEYDYDGVIWEMSYTDHEQRFLSEIGDGIRRPGLDLFLEVGCGLGITTELAHKNSGADAAGVDLSLAVWKAARRYRDNPFLHFVQASVFAMPFAPRTFDAIYSRGVLHHTVSTERAFRNVTPLAKPGGTVYLWVYGTGSIRETAFRRVVYGLERLVRPSLSNRPDTLLARAFLRVMGAGYMVFNALRRVRNPAIQPLTFERGVHAARDRFTPRYAHRHEVDEVTSWFVQAGFTRTELLDWKAMPAADHDDFRRNVGVRGTLPDGVGA